MNRRILALARAGSNGYFRRARPGARLLVRVSPILDTPPFTDKLSPSVKHGLSGAPVLCPGRAVLTASTRTESSHETPVPTVEDPPQTAARLFEPELHPERAGHLAKSPPRRTQAPDPGLIRLWPHHGLRCAFPGRCA